MLKENELLEIEKRCGSGTLGPWKAFIEGRDHTSGGNFLLTGYENNRGEDLEINGALIEDYDFIANAKQDVPKLIGEIRRLRAIIDQL
jgi:hypothetical protein